MIVEHDPLCDNQPEYFDGSILWPQHCTCHIIVKVRADEREKAARRVETLMPERVITGGGVAYCDALREAAAAVRGQS